MLSLGLNCKCHLFSGSVLPYYSRNIGRSDIIPQLEVSGATPSLSEDMPSISGAFFMLLIEDKAIYILGPETLLVISNIILEGRKTTPNLSRESGREKELFHSRHIHRPIQQQRRYRHADGSGAPSLSSIPSPFAAIPPVRIRQFLGNRFA